MGNVGLGFSFGNLRFRRLVWETSFRNVRSGSFVWSVRVGVFCLIVPFDSFPPGVSFGIFRVRTFAEGFPFGNFSS